MSFFTDFLCTMDSTGHPQTPRQSRTMGSDTPGRKNAFSQTVSGDVVMFPKIEPRVAPGRAAGERPLQTHKGWVKEKKMGEARREEEPKRTGLLTDMCRLLSRRRLSPTRLPRMTVEGELGEAARAKEPSLRLPAVFKESSSRKGEGKHKQSAMALPQALPDVCEGHWRAGQDAQYPYLQQDEGSLQASLAGEQLQREGEDEWVWAEHQDPRERDAAKRAWVQLMPRGPLSLRGGTPGAWVAPVELKQQQHFFIPHPPEKTMEAAALEKSLTNCLPVRGTWARRLLEKRKEDL